MDKPLPERCLRGVRDENHIHRDPTGPTIWVLSAAFVPNPKTREVRVRNGKSDHYEASVNWEDNAAGSFEILCNDKSNAKCGIVSIRLADLQKARDKNPLAASSLDWEREGSRNNPFHGNLLFSARLPTKVVKELAAVVATHVQDRMRFIEPEHYEAELATRANHTTASTKRGILAFFQTVSAKVRTFLGSLRPR
jgi:hypothetical protein